MPRKTCFRYDIETNLILLTVRDAMIYPHEKVRSYLRYATGCPIAAFKFMKTKWWLELCSYYDLDGKKLADKIYKKKTLDTVREG